MCRSVSPVGVRPPPCHVRAVAAMRNGNSGTKRLGGQRQANRMVQPSLSATGVPVEVLVSSAIASSFVRINPPLMGGVIDHVFSRRAWRAREPIFDDRATVRSVEDVAGRTGSWRFSFPSWGGRDANLATSVS